MKPKTLVFLAFISLFAVVFCQTERDGLALGPPSIAFPGIENPWSEENINEDSDGDGLLNSADKCPTVAPMAGVKSIDGCPDSDGDGIKDYREVYYAGNEHLAARLDKTYIDLCPRIAAPGLDIELDADLRRVTSYNGCPSTNCNRTPDGALASVRSWPTNAAEPQHGGGGIPYYLCPGPGVSGYYNCFWNSISAGGRPLYPDTDCDGQIDYVSGMDLPLDKCVREPGPRWTGGCPDRDNDGIPDRDYPGEPDTGDRCPALPGVAAYQGCPGNDWDGDGIVNGGEGGDSCPNLFGVAEYNGCPVNDHDGDGILNTEDRCPEERGTAMGHGCPIHIEPGSLSPMETDSRGTIGTGGPSPGSRLEGVEVRPDTRWGIPEGATLPTTEESTDVPPSPPPPSPPPTPPAGSTETTTPTGGETATTPSTTEGTVEVDTAQTPGSSPYSRKDFTGRESYGLNQGGGCSLHPFIRVE